MQTDDILVQYENNAVTCEENLVFKNLIGCYNWRAQLMGKGPSGSTLLSISPISSYIKINHLIRILKINHLWGDLKGFDERNFVLQAIINLICNAFKSSLPRVMSSSV